MIKLDETNRLAAAMLARIADSLPGNVEVPAIFNAEDMELINAFRTEREAIQHKDAITKAITLLKSHGHIVIDSRDLEWHSLRCEDLTAAKIPAGSITHEELNETAVKTPKLNAEDMTWQTLRCEDVKATKLTDAAFSSSFLGMLKLPVTKAILSENPNDRVPSEISFKAAKAICNLVDLIDDPRDIDNWTAKQIRKARKVLRDHPRGPSSKRA